MTTLEAELRRLIRRNEQTIRRARQAKESIDRVLRESEWRSREAERELRRAGVLK